MLNEALAENERLSVENRRLKARAYAAAGGDSAADEYDGYTVMLRLPDDGVCRPFYPTEAYELVVNVLQQAVRFYCGEDNVRCTELLNGLIQANPLHGDRLAWEREVKRILSANQGLKMSDIRSLRELGFDVREVKDGNGHWAVSYGGMKRYRFRAPATPGDWKSMKNLGAEIISKTTVYKNPRTKNAESITA